MRKDNRDFNVSPEASKKAKNMLYDLLQFETGLTPVEWQFVKSMSVWSGLFRYRQAAKIEDIWKEHC